jgi:hypothetical protein
MFGYLLLNFWWMYVLLHCMFYVQCICVRRCLSVIWSSFLVVLVCKSTTCRSVPQSHVLICGCDLRFAWYYIHCCCVDPGPVPRREASGSTATQANRTRCFLATSISVSPPRTKLGISVTKMSTTYSSSLKHRNSSNVKDSVTYSKPGTSQLSYDVLGYIFAFVAPIPYKQDTFERTTFLYKQEHLPFVHFLAFSQVCRHWRRVALAIPTLWSSPLLYHLELGGLMLERSGKAPLTVMWPPIQVKRGRLAYIHSQYDSEKLQSTTFEKSLETHVRQISALDVLMPENFGMKTCVVKCSLNREDSASCA